MLETEFLGDEGGSVLMAPPAALRPMTKLPWRTAKELAAISGGAPDWLVKPYIAIGAITDFSARVKLGKTRLIMDGVAALLQGADFLGNPTRRVSVVYLTEEGVSTIQQALARAGLLESVDLHVLLRHDARGLNWPDLVAEAVAKCRDADASLLVVDTLPDWADLRGDEENNSGRALEAMQPLRDAAAGGLAIVMLRHDRKSGGAVGDSARGSSAFAGAADILLSLKPADGKERTTSRRLLEGVGRFDGIPPVLTVDLVDGHYVALGEGRDALVRTTADRIHELLTRDGGVLLLKSIREQLGAGVSKKTAENAVALLESEGKVEVVTGQGRTKRAKGYRAQ